MSKLIRFLTCLMLLVLPLGGLAPAASFAKTTGEQSAKEELVFVTQNGKKYHKQGCRFIKNRETVSVTQQEAISKGLVPCGRCFKVNEQAKQ